MTTWDTITYIIAITYSTEALIFFFYEVARLVHIHTSYIILFMFVFLLLYK